MAPSPMGIFSRSFEAMFATQPTMRASVRVGKDIVARCLCGSFATTRTATDEGVYEAVVASVKMLKADWPAKGKIEGTKVDFMRSGETEWKPCRVVGTSETDGILSLVIEAEFA